jgi:hypothetical protein
VSDQLNRLQQLRHTLVRLGAGPAGRYWSNAWRVFASNLMGGIAAGAAASVLAALILGIDAHRGQDSFVYSALSDLQTVVRTIQALVERELHQ